MILTLSKLNKKKSYKELIFYFFRIFYSHDLVVFIKENWQRYYECFEQKLINLTKI